jgi:hypothetical protein
MNKNFIFCVTLGFCISLLNGCGLPSSSGSGTVRIRVTGTDGLAFTGTATGHTWGGKTVTQELNGTVPAEFMLAVANHLDYSIQKSGLGNLQVNVKYGFGESTAGTAVGLSPGSHGVRGYIRPWSEMTSTF